MLNGANLYRFVPIFFYSEVNNGKNNQDRKTGSQAE